MPGFIEEEAVPRVTEDLRNMSVSANEYVGVPVVDERLGPQIVLWLARIISPVTATAKPDVGHETNPHTQSFGTPDNPV